VGVSVAGKEKGKEKGKRKKKQEEGREDSATDARVLSRGDALVLCLQRPREPCRDASRLRNVVVKADSDVSTHSDEDIATVVSSLTASSDSSVLSLSPTTPVYHSVAMAASVMRKQRVAINN
jgi:tRNA U54 and U55 pseudouridine synthase Pus10